MSEVVDGFFKQLRKHVKEKHSNTRIWQFLDTVYKSGYRQGMLDAAAKLNAVAEMSAKVDEMPEYVPYSEEDAADAIQKLDSGNDHDRVGGQSDSPVTDGGSGTDTNDADSDTGSAGPASAE